MSKKGGKKERSKEKQKSATLKMPKWQFRKGLIDFVTILKLKRNGALA